LRDRGHCAGQFGGRPQQVVDHGVDGGFHLAPGAAGLAEAQALAGLALAADDLAHLFQFPGHPLIGGDDVVECVRDLARQPDLVARQADRKVADPHRLQRMEQASHGVGRIDQIIGRRQAWCRRRAGPYRAIWLKLGRTLGAPH
jgi:hypothetical protein